MAQPTTGWLDEQEYEAEIEPEAEYFTRAAAEIRHETRKRIIFNEAA